MRKAILFFSCWLFVLANPSFSITFRPTPPPISCLNFFKDVNQWTVTGMYFKMGELESETSESPTAYGIMADASVGVKDGEGSIVSAHYTAFNWPTGETNLTGNFYGAGLIFVSDLVLGEKKDIAGEIIEKETTVAGFYGVSLDRFEMDMGKMFGELLGTNEFKFSKTDLGLPVGIAADIPLGFYASIVPFGRYVWRWSWMKTPTLGFESVSKDTTTKESYGSIDYGADIDLRLFRNAPEWKISIGTVLSQAEGLKNGNLLIMISLKREIGKHYSSTLIGPKLH
ncbi:MAG: hypothetical protein AB1393_14500 [Candidatus Edwardsbacteria bacterium]